MFNLNPPGYNVTCPKLICDDNYFAQLADKNLCFQMKHETAGMPIYARNCFSEEESKKPDAKPMFCEYDLLNNQFSWINETIQGDGRLNSGK